MVKSWRRCLVAVLYMNAIRELIQRNVSDLQPANGLSLVHVSVSAMKRMRVSLAVQLSHETTGKALQHFGQRGLLKSKNWHETSQFISLFYA